MGITDHLTCLLRNLYAVQEATVRTAHGTTNRLQIGKGVHQGCILSPCLFNLYAEYIMRNTGLDEAQAGIKIARRNINNLRYADDISPMVESKEELSLLMKVKEESEKAGLKLNIQKAKIMASGPINSWQIVGETMETVTDFIFLGSKITVDGDCSCESKRHLLLGRKAFSSSHVQMWQLDHKEGWEPKNDAFKMCCWRRLGIPLDNKETQPVHPKGNQPWIFIERTDAEAEAPSRWPPNAKSQLVGKDLDAWEDWRHKEKGNDKRQDDCLALPTQWTWDLASSRRWGRREKPQVLQSMGLQRVRCDWATEQEQHY